MTNAELEADSLNKRCDMTDYLNAIKAADKDAYNQLVTKFHNESKVTLAKVLEPQGACL